MKPTVKLANSVARFISELPREVRVPLYQKLLVDLPANPDELLGERVFPYAMKHEFHVTLHSDDPRWRRWFVFVVDLGTEGELHIDYVRDTNDPPLD